MFKRGPKFTKYMKIKMLLILLIFGVFATFVLAAAPFQNNLHQCYDTCTQVKKVMAEGCHTGYDECRATCATTYETCKAETTALNQQCRAGCETNRTPACILTCRQQYSFTKLCEEDSCNKGCSQKRRECLDSKQELYKICRGRCPYSVQNITCSNGQYQVGDVYLDGCDKCRCNPTGEISCSNTINCNLENLSISQQECQSNGNLFQPVCKGNYFRLRCTRPSYCLCYDSCPDDYVCVKNFTVKVKSEIDTYIGPQGEPLGDVGICAKRPDLLECGNDICESACLGNDCSNAESAFTCPEDCF